MPWRLAGLTTRGRYLLAAGLATALCAVLVDERDLLRVAAFAILLPLLASSVVALRQAKLRADRDLVPSRITVGGDCQVHLTLHGTGRLGGRLLLEDVVPPALGSRYRAVMARLPRSGAVKLSYPLRPVQRTVHSVGPLIVRITDPLGLAEYRPTLAGHNRLIVIPAVVSLSGLPAGGELGNGEAAGGRVGIGPGQDAVVVRSYRQGDDLRKVHWRTSARRDELMVRVEEWPERGGATVLLDHRNAAHRGSGPTSSLEYAVSLAASAYAHLRQHGQQVRLVTADGLVLAGAADRTDHTIDTALDALAALRATDQRDLASGPAMAGRQDVVAVLGALGPVAVEQLLAHRPRGRRSHAVLLDVAAWGAADNGSAIPDTADPAPAARLLAAAGWSVAVARPEQTPSAVWDRLCSSSRSKLQVPR
ncbi:MAG: DUF58 domain-containing protein [Pseudonocardiales bacterium]|nr:DUF58 domain-containing protein [Actinomycetota bacterium]PZS17728.1 MAG: DUF58 domain-containing protein [Pseudonocardiales bacterium]